MCVFLGYPPDQKAYKVFCLETGKMIVTRDISFHEHHLPYQYLAASPTPSPSSSPIYLPVNTPVTMDIAFDIPEPLIFPDDISPTHPTSTNTSDSPASSSPEPSPNLSTSTQPTSPSQTQPTSSAIPPRHSTRSKHKPTYLDNYVCLAEHITSHWCNIVQFSQLQSSTQTHINHTTNVVEPVNYWEAAQHRGWVKAMKELDVLNANQTWEMVPLPKHKKRP